MRAHLAAPTGIGEDAVDFYSILASRQIRLALDKADLNAEFISLLEDVIRS